MIGRLRGVVDGYGEDHVILDVHGVGYLVHCSARTLQSLPPAGEAATLHVETVVREDMIRLFGFATPVEKDWFNILIGVQGVGQKVALAILSTLRPADLANAIAMKDKAAIARAPGVGPKLAERICVELKGKAPVFGGIDPAIVALAGDVGDGRASGPVRDAISALVNLGYGEPQATGAIAAAAKVLGGNAETGALIRQGLKELAK
ncbi:MAG: Holliday junction branch migration protein RuvA [Hyphomicrobiales bacterium]|nr:Holliday junction branch migration protein RuvA [Hyphomicrobiales bacterium]MCA1998399.1 Holliday junction branch migration protein RuvA [Hyphomicrobiales bacterium]